MSARACQSRTTVLKSHRLLMPVHTGHLFYFNRCEHLWHDLTTYINVFCSSRYSGHVWSVQAISVVCSPVFDDSGARVCLTTRVHGCALWRTCMWFTTSDSGPTRGLTCSSRSRLGSVYDTRGGVLYGCCSVYKLVYDSDFPARMHLLILLGLNRRTRGLCW